MNVLEFRPASIDDCELYFNWANDKSVRQNSFHTGLIGWHDHKKWFQNRLDDNNSYLYIVKTSQSDIGQVRFDCANGVATIDYSVSSNFRGKGFGKVLVWSAIKKIREDYPEVKKIKAQVKIDNIASNKIFLKLGFNKQGEVKRVAIYQLELKK